jgi:preprotein translocase subunit SecY
MSMVGGAVLTMIAILPFLLQMWGVPAEFTVGGTSAIIAIAVSLDIWEQIKARRLAETSSSKQLKELVSQNVDVIDYNGKALFE